METEIDRLVVEIETEREDCAAKLDKLAAALDRLAASANGLGSSSESMSKFLDKIKKLESAARPVAEKTRRVTGGKGRDPDGSGPEISRKLESVIQNPLADATPSIPGDTVGDKLADGLNRAKDAADQVAQSLRRVAESASTADATGASTGFQKTRMAAEQLMSTLDGMANRVKSVFNAIIHPIQTLKQGLTSIADTAGSSVLNALNALLHPIQTLKSATWAVKSAWSKVFPSVKTAASGIGSIFNGFLHPIRTASGLLGKFRSMLRGTGGDARTANRSVSLFGSGILKSVSRILMYRVIRSVLSGITNGISTGITNLYHANSTFAASMDRCATSAQYLKNSLAAALAPAINALAPVIDYVVDRVVDFINVISQLIAIMTGASSWTKAVKAPAQWGDAADSAASSAGNANEAAKELQRTLMGFDEINKLSANSSGGSGGGAGGGAGTDYSSMFSTQQVALDGVTGNLADIWQVFRDAWNSTGSSVMESAQNALESLKTAASDVGETLYNVWTDGTGQRFIESILERVRSLLDIVDVLASTFDEAWKHAGQGEDMVRAIFDRMTEVNQLIADIRDAFTGVWSNGTGELVWGNLFKIITNVNNTITNLAANFRSAWNGGNGSEIWQAILNAVNTVLDHIRNCASATAEWASRLDLEPLLTGVKNVLKSIQPIVDVIFRMLEDMWNNVALPLGEWALENRLPAFLDGVASVLQTIGDIASKVVRTIEALGNYISGIQFNGLDGIINGNGLFTMPDIDLTATISSVWASGSTPRDKRNEFTKGCKPTASVTPKMSQSKSTFWNGWYKGWSATASVTPKMSKSKSTLWNSWYKGWSAKASITPSMVTSASSLARSYARELTSGFKKNPARVYVSLPKVQYSSGANGTLKPRATNTMYRLARGGIVNRATMFSGFEAGEDGAEAIIPLENHTEWLDKVADRLLQKTGNSGENRIVIENKIYLDGKQIYQGTYEDIRAYSRSHGGALPFPV